jgi:hypothetical protein
VETACGAPVAAVMYLGCTSGRPFMCLRWNCRTTLIQLSSCSLLGPVDEPLGGVEQLAEDPTSISPRVSSELLIALYK